GRGDRQGRRRRGPGPRLDRPARRPVRRGGPSRGWPVALLRPQARSRPPGAEARRRHGRASRPATSFPLAPASPPPLGWRHGLPEPHPTQEKPVTRKTDTAPTPVITFATPEAGNRVLADLRAKYEEAARYAAAKGGLAVQRGEEIAVLEGERSEEHTSELQSRENLV